MLDLLRSAGDLALVILGFGMVIVVHELGHFLAARWAGIRVHEFAIGFGPAIASYRKGMGLRSGSTARAYQELVKRDPDASARVSPTEYRLNYFPLGGYVKMLGQEDLNPSATSLEPDSYAAKPVWKRLIVISAGVTANVVLAAAVFIVVYAVGLPAPPPVIGSVAPGSPAAAASPVDAGSAGAGEKGLRPGDRVLIADGDTVDSFNDLFSAVAMARSGRPVALTIDRPGVATPLEFLVTPRKGEQSKLLEIGVTPATSLTLFDTGGDASGAALMAREFERAGVGGLVEPGMTLVSVDGQAVSRFDQLKSLASASGGAAMKAEFRAPAGRTVDAELRPRPELQTTVSAVPIGRKSGEWPVEHLLGLAPPPMVSFLDAGGEKAGLRVGDILARVGSVDWPNPAQAIAQVRRAAGATIDVTVVRDGRFESLTAPVNAEGQIGFIMGSAGESTAIATRPPTPLPPKPGEQPPDPTAAERLGLLPGTTILRVGDEPVINYATMREALRRATAHAAASHAAADVRLTVRLPMGRDFGAGPTDEVSWALTPDDVAALHALGWASPLPEYLFKPAETMIVAHNPVQALAKGASETRRVIGMTYLTLVRLFEGSVKVEHLKGPVGIAHIGTQFAGRGMISLLFFLAIISANLAVLNFLPLPIVDGGHVIFLLVEWITRKPVSVAVQNAATIVGLLLIGALFLVVTFNDIVGVFR